VSWSSVHGKTINSNTDFFFLNHVFFFKDDQREILLKCFHLFKGRIQELIQESYRNLDPVYKTYDLGNCPGE